MGLYIPDHRILVMAPPKAGSVYVLNTIALTLNELGIRFITSDSPLFEDKSPHLNLLQWYHRLSSAKLPRPEFILNYVRNPYKRVRSFFNFAKIDSTGRPFWDSDYLNFTNKYLNQDDWLTLSSIPKSIYNNILYQNWIKAFVLEEFLSSRSMANRVNILTFRIEQIDYLFNSFIDLIGIPSSAMLFSSKKNKEGVDIASFGRSADIALDFRRFCFNPEIIGRIARDFKKEIDIYYSDFDANELVSCNSLKL